jgi:hypothetical protein
MHLMKSLQPISLTTERSKKMTTLKKTAEKKPAAQKLVTEKKVPAIGVVKERKPVAAKPRASKKVTAASKVSEEERKKMIADNAYFRAQRRNFSPDGIEEDWLEAEAEVTKNLI